MNFIVYDTATGSILRTGVCAEDHIALQAREGETAIGDRWEGTSDSRHRIDENGERVEAAAVLAAAPSASLQRFRAYPPVGDQLDALWHAMDKGIFPMVPAFYDPIKAVKDAIPKDAEP